MVLSRTCPACGKIVDGAGEVAEGQNPVAVRSRHPVRPHPGDLAICANCGAVGSYGNDFQIEPADLAGLDDDTRRTVETMQAAIRGRRVRNGR